MIHFFVGKPRNGKSFLACKRILDRLQHTKKFVCTNMRLDLDEVQQYLDARGARTNVRARVRMLSDDETRDFWLYRAFGYVLPKPDGYADKHGANVDYAPLFEDPRFTIDGDPMGTLYVIDECHTIWPARGWQQTPRHADFYMSQHGKLGDEVIFITQNTKLVDPNFYRLAQDFTYCTNYRLKKYGRFRGANKFVARTYPMPATSGNEVTLNEEEYKLDLEIGACYDTSAGVGMPGGGKADGGARVAGMSLKWVWVGVAAACLCVWFGMAKGLPMLTNRFLAPAIDPKGQGAKVGQAVGLTAAPAAASAAAPARAAPVPASDGTARVIGYSVSGREVIVWLSDGRVLTHRSRDLDRITEDAVYVAGQRYEFRRKAPTADPSAVGASATPTPGPG